MVIFSPQKANHYNSQKLKRECLELISNNTSAQNQEGFSSLSPETIIEVIDCLPPELARQMPPVTTIFGFSVNLRHLSTGKLYSLLLAIKKWLQVNAVGKISPKLSIEKIPQSGSS